MKNTFKQKFAFLLAMTMLLSSLPTTAFALDDANANEQPAVVSGQTSAGVLTADGEAEGEELAEDAETAKPGDLNDVNNWITDRTEPENFKIENGTISFSVKEEPGSDSWYGWQGRKAYTETEVSNYWKVSYTMDVTDTMLAQKNVNTSVWIQVDKAGANSAASQKDCVDWSIIQFVNTDTIKWQSWDANGSGTWKNIDTSTDRGTYTITTEFFNGKITQSINDEVVNSYELDETETAPVCVIAQGRSYGAAFDVAVGVPEIDTDRPEMTFEVATEEELISALDAFEKGDTIQVQDDIALTQMLNIQKDDVALDLGGNTITASEEFEYSAKNSVDRNAEYENDRHLVNVTGDNVTIENGVLKATADNKHVLNVYEAENCVVKDMVLNHVDAWKGAPLVVNGSTVTIKDNFEAVTGNNSWYAVNVDNKTDSAGADTTLTFAKNAQVIFSGTPKCGIVLETSKENVSTTVEFETGVDITALDGVPVVAEGETQKGTVVVTNPGNAGLIQNENGSYVEATPEAENTITVTDADGNVNYYKSLSKAIAEAKNGAIVELAKGTYTLNMNECLILNKKLTIQGAGADTIVKGSSSVNYGNGMFTFTGGSEGSVLKDMTISYKATGAQTSSVYFNGTFTGGSVENVTKVHNVNFVGGDTLETIGKEMAITSTYNNTESIGYIDISGCSFKNFAYAMYFNRLSDSNIENCSFDGTKYNAINIAADGTEENSGSKNVTIQNNTMVNISYANYEADEYSSGIRIGVNAEKIILQNNAIQMLNGKKPIYIDPVENDTRITVTFRNDDVVYNQQILEQASTITLPAALSKSGYEFEGWKDDAGTIHDAGDEVTIDKDTTFTAVWDRISSGGASHPSAGDSSSSSSSSGNKTETTENSDGSTTTTTTSSNGTVTETTKYEDGSKEVIKTDKDGNVTTTYTDADGNKTETVEKEDGSVKTTIDNKDGSSSTTIVDEDGKTQAEVTLSDETIANAIENGEAVKLPMPEVEATTSREDAPTVTVNLASSVAKVEIPVEDVTAGTVAVLVKADGTEEVIKTTVTTEDGILVALNDGDTVKIVDNSKTFADVAANYWGSEGIDFASSRELFTGTSETTFSPEQNMSRAMIWTVLARLDGADTTQTSGTWYQAGLDWAIASGISDGSNPNGAMTREQLVTMLYRYAGSPEGAAELTGYTDLSNVNDYAADAMAWAVDTGLVSGMGDGTLAPQGTATRAQVATILMRFCENVAK